MVQKRKVKFLPLEDCLLYLIEKNLPKFLKGFSIPILMEILYLQWISTNGTDGRNYLSATVFLGFLSTISATYNQVNGTYMQYMLVKISYHLLMNPATITGR